MKYRNLLTLLALSLSIHSSVFGQVSETLKNLEGSWYQETRNSITYSNWQKSGDQTFENRTFSLVCGDTIYLSRALLVFTEAVATLTVFGAGEPQRYRLTSFDNGHLAWENEASDGIPKNLNWKFLRGGYCSLIEDGVETDFRKSFRQPFKLRFRASLGANMSQYANPVGSNRFLANLNIAAAQGKTQMLPGTEAAISVGMLFPSAPMCLNFELGMAYRKVGVEGSFYNARTATLSVRDGEYRNYNYYLAVIPEVFLGEHRNFSLSAGFYSDVIQQRFFRGISSATNADSPNPFMDNVSNDLNLEHGMMFGVQYRVPALNHLHPSVYLRYTHGMNNTNVRALTLGISTDFEIR
jgi:hypothetical protein